MLTLTLAFGAACARTSRSDDLQPSLDVILGVGWVRRATVDTLTASGCEGRGVPPPMIHRQRRRDLSPQIPRQTLHRLLIPHPTAMLQQQHHLANSADALDGRPIRDE